MSLLVEVQARSAVIAGPAGVDGSVQRREQALVVLVCEPKRAADAAGPVKRAVEPFRDPGPHRRGSADNELPGAANRCELELREPDLECALADDLAEDGSDLVPVGVVLLGRFQELRTDRGEVNRHGPLSLPAAIGDVVLLDRHQNRLGGPPCQGGRGV